ncbi:MAG: helix-turn-helix domain-containing protein [Methyloceanibacter sp.]|uniref:helix-turn-helix domain-containing protein n=1 Tax=Methyloceanibacter sp. TaxID=1965321 RepID=UPI003EDEA6C7
MHAGGREPACMAKPYSDDLRVRVAAAIADGESCRSIAERYDIAPSTVVKWSTRARDGQPGTCQVRWPSDVQSRSVSRLRARADRRRTPSE